MHSTNFLHDKKSVKSLATKLKNLAQKIVATSLATNIADFIFCYLKHKFLGLNCLSKINTLLIVCTNFGILPKSKIISFYKHMCVKIMVFYQNLQSKKKLKFWETKLTHILLCVLTLVSYQKSSQGAD